MKLLKSKKNKIEKSKKIIQDEKEKIKKEKRKVKQDKKKPKKDNTKISFSNIKLENYTQKEVLLTIVISMFIGALACISVIYILCGNFITNYKDLSKLFETYSTISKNYYGELDKQTIVDSAINAMVDSVGDNFTTYTDTETTESFKENVEGTYEGIGCTVATTTTGEIFVASIFDNSPSSEAGLQVGDIIIKVDDKNYEEKTSADVATYVKNSSNSKIKFTIKRNDKEIELMIKRDKIEVPVVSSEVYEINNHKIGYISISIFSKVADTQFKEKLKELEKNKIEGLVIDVRNNGGGYLTTVTNITNQLLPKGKIIYQLENNNKTEKIKDTTKEKRTYPIAVIINSESASASEILASAIKESYNGLVVGTNSYGKGTVQQTKTLKDGSMIKFTTQNWLTPKGNWINETGVEPTDYIESDPTTEEDNQLQETLKLIGEKIK